MNMGLQSGGVFDGYAFGHAAAGVEGGNDFHPSWMSHGNEVVEDRVGDVFVIDALVAEALQVKLEALQFDADFVGRVGDRNRAEVGLARFRTDGRELRRGDFDLIIAIGKLILEGFEQIAKVGHCCYSCISRTHCGMMRKLGKGSICEYTTGGNGENGESIWGFFSVVSVSSCLIYSIVFLSLNTDGKVERESSRGGRAFVRRA